MAHPIAAAFKAAAPRPPINAPRKDKKNYAERLSRELSTATANALRSDFSGVLPEEDGSRQESKARTSKGFKKLDVNYSTTELGLGLGVSIKTINFRDPRTKRYTKNYTRVDNELRAEAIDYHLRQPYSVLIGVVFLPLDSCKDGKRANPSSFGACVKSMRPRSGRSNPEDAAEKFEAIFIGLLEFPRFSRHFLGYTIAQGGVDEQPQVHAGVQGRGGPPSHRT